MKKILVLVLGIAACPSCTSKVDAAYKTCVDQQNEKLMKQAESGPPALKETLEADGHKLSEAVCGPIKTLCKDDFDGTMCQQTIKALTK
jgi:hypothetical protein